MYRVFLYSRTRAATIKTACKIFTLGSGWLRVDRDTWKLCGSVCLERWNVGNVSKLNTTDLEQFVS